MSSSSSTSLSLFNTAMLPNDLWGYIGRSLVVRDLTALFLSNVYLYSQSIHIFRPIDRDAYTQLGLEYTEGNSVNLDRWPLTIGSVSTIGEIVVHPLRFLTLERILSVWLRYSPAELIERRTFIETQPILPLYSDLLEDAKVLYSAKVMDARNPNHSKGNYDIKNELWFLALDGTLRFGERFVITRASPIHRDECFGFLIRDASNGNQFKQLINIFAKNIRPEDKSGLFNGMCYICKSVVAEHVGVNYDTEDMDANLDAIAREVFEKIREILFSLFDRREHNQVIDSYIDHIHDTYGMTLAETVRSLISEERMRLGFVDEDDSDFDEDISDVEYPSAPTTTASAASIITTTPATDEPTEQESKGVKRKSSSPLPEDERRPEKKQKRSESPNGSNVISTSDGRGNIDTREASENAPDVPDTNASVSEDQTPAKKSSLYSDLMSDDEE